MMEANHGPYDKVGILNGLIICRILRQSNTNIRLIDREPRRENLIGVVARDPQIVPKKASALINRIIERHQWTRIWEYKLIRSSVAHRIFRAGAGKS